MKLRGLLLGLTVVLATALRATSLAPDLVYLRAGTDPAIAAKLLQTGSAVIDLRFQTDEAAAAPLVSALKAAPDGSPRLALVLVSPETAPALVSQLKSPGKLLTIGRAAAKPDIAVNVSAESDRRSFDAIIAGTPPEKLVREQLEKPRFDESALIREHLGRNDPELPISLDKKIADEKTAASAPLDLVLQRAVQVHRGLVVLNKI